MDFGTDDVFEASLSTHAAAARRLAYRLLRDPDDAEDVAQESLRIVLERPPSEGRPTWPWLAGIVRNVSHAFRRRKRRDSRPADAEERATDDPAALAAAVDAQRAVLEVLSRLEEPYRATLILRYVRDLPASEVATLQAIPLETVRTRSKRGIELLRTQMDARHEGDRRRWMAILAPLLPDPRASGTTVAAAGAGAILVKKVAAALLVLLLVGGITWIVFAVAAPRSVSPRGEEVAGAGGTRAPLEGRPGPSLTAGTPALTDAEDAAGAVDRNLDLHGVVVREDGTPIPGARLRALRRAWQDLPLVDLDRALEEKEMASGLTAADGTFALRLNPGLEVFLEVGAPGFGRVDVARCQPGERLRVVLRPAVRLDVSVREEGGAAVAGCPVRFFRKEGRPGTDGPFERTAFHRAGRTDAAGRLSFEDLPGGGRGSLVAEPPTQGSPEWMRVELPSAGSVAREVVVPTGRVLHGRILDARTRRGIPGARVGMAWAQRQAVLADAEGRFTLPGWTGRGITAVFASAAGYGQTGVEVGAREEFDILLPPAFRVTGRLVDGGGLPVPAARLAVGSPQDARSLEWTLLATESDAGGKFAFDQLRADRAHALRISAEGHGRLRFDLRPPSAGDTVDLGDVLLPAAARIEGAVLASAEQGLPGVLVVLRGGNGDRGRFQGPGPGFLAEDEESQSRVTDDLGRFSFADLAPGRYIASLEVPARAPSAASAPVLLEEAEVRRIEIRLSPTRAVHVTVIWTEKPDLLPWVGAQRSREALHSVAVSETGEATLEVPHESVRVWVSPAIGWFASPPVDVPVGTDQVTLRLDKAETVEGVLVGPDGSPLAGASVQARVGDEYQSNTVTDAEGRFRLHVRPGSTSSLHFRGGFQVTRADRRYEEVERPLRARLDDVRAGSRGTTLRAESLPEGQRLRVRVLTPEGAPAEGTSVMTDQRRFARTDANGEASLSGLIGRETLVQASADPVQAEKGWLAARTALVPEGQTVELRLRQGLVIRGRVLDAAGEPVPDALVATRTGDLELVSTKTDARGAFWFPVDPLEHLPLTITVTLSGSPVVAELTLDDSPSGDVILRLPR